MSDIYGVSRLICAAVGIDVDVSPVRSLTFTQTAGDVGRLDIEIDAFPTVDVPPVVQRFTLTPIPDPEEPCPAP